MPRGASRADVLSIGLEFGGQAAAGAAGLRRKSDRSAGCLRLFQSLSDFSGFLSKEEP